MIAKAEGLKKADSRGKSKRGGKRAGAGRKPDAVKKLRRDYQETSTAILGGWLPELLNNLKALADGIKVEGDEGEVYSTAPDREANKYLIDRVLGKPTEPTENKTNVGILIRVKYEDARLDLADAP